MAAIRCDIPGCTLARKNWKTPTALGSHKWRAHQVKGSARKVKAKRGRPKAQVTEILHDEGYRPARQAPQLLTHEPTNGSAVVQAILKKAEEYREKARELMALAEKAKHLL